MIKCMFFLYRLPHLSPDEFYEYWSGVHSRLAIETATTMRMRRYVQNHRRRHPIGEAFQSSRGCAAADFDGVAEAWWDSFEVMAEAAGSTPPEVGAAILQDEGRFVDMKRSLIWFAEEKQFWPEKALSWYPSY